MIKKKMKFLNSKFKILHSKRQGAALLVVLFIIMAITILSLGFLSRSDVELACGKNMILHTQMDYLAESGLEHAKGLILNPQDIEDDYWTGSEGRQLAEGSSDYYDVRIIRDENEPNNYCNYNIECDAYRQLADGSEVGRSSIKAVLRLDPCIAFSVGESTTFWNTVNVYGDVNCVGTLTNQGTIDGDVFADSLTGTITGQKYDISNLALSWPQVTMSDFTGRYEQVNILTPELVGVPVLNIGPFDPVQICLRDGSLVLAGNVKIKTMLVVNGDLTIRGNGNVITAAQNVTALLVIGDLILEKDAILSINGLAVVEGSVFIGSDNSQLNILGGLFTRGKISRAIVDSSGYGRRLVLYNGPTWRPSGGHIAGTGALDFDGVNDRAEDPCAPDYLNGLSAITVSLWVKSDVTNQDRDIFFTHDPTDADDYLGLRYDEDGYFGHAVRCIKAFILTTSGVAQIESSSDVQTTSWQHLAIVWQSGTDIRLYINGIFNSPTYHTVPQRTGTTTGVQKLMLGLGSKSQYWNGLIDDVQIYNRGLSDIEINTVKAGVTVSGLIAYWKLDDSGNSGTVTITAEPAKTAVLLGPQGNEQHWGQAAGAFFRSIQRR